MSRSNMRSRKSGFSLLETLVAFAIATFAMVAILSVFRSLSLVDSSLVSKTPLYEFAEAQLTRFSVTGQDQDREGFYAGQWRWQITEDSVEDEYWEGAELEWRLVILEISVTSVLRDFEKVTLETYALYPPWRAIQ